MQFRPCQEQLWETEMALGRDANRMGRWGLRGQTRIERVQQFAQMGIREGLCTLPVGPQPREVL